MRGHHQIYGHLWSEGWLGEKKDIPEIVCKSFEENTFLFFNLVDIRSWIFAVTQFPIVVLKDFSSIVCAELHFQYEEVSLFNQHTNTQ